MTETMPRCATCRFWHRYPPVPVNTVGLPEGFGGCWLFGDDDSFDGSRPPVLNPPERLALICPFAGADGATLDTHESFGCVQHEAAE
jgi:hypothetical protein